MKIEITENEDKIDISGDFRIMSSAPLNGGLRNCKKIINHQVNDNESGNIRKTLENKLGTTQEELNSTVGFLTAADVEKSFNEEISVDGGDIKIIITAGIGKSLESNTINIILITNLDLTETGMANLFIVITEAKANALRKLDINHEKEPITGTPTDAIAVAKTNNTKGEKIKYTGTATNIGNEVYKVVEEGVKEALKKQENYQPDREALKRLEERNISLQDLIDTAFELYEPEKTGKDEEELRSRLKELFKYYTRDKNIHFLLTASMLLEREKNRLDLEKDPSYIISDELIGNNIAEYIAGKKAHFNFTRYDKEKPGILKDLDVFMDDAVAGLIAGCMTKLFEEKRRNQD